MNNNRFLLALLSIICLGSFTTERGAQAAIAQTCATSRSLLTNGFNAWMANRNTLNYIGLGLFSANVLLYTWFRNKYLKETQQLQQSRTNDIRLTADPQYLNSVATEGKMLHCQKWVYPIATLWLLLSLKPEALLGIIASHLISSVGIYRVLGSESDFNPKIYGPYILPKNN